MRTCTLRKDTRCNSEISIGDNQEVMKRVAKYLAPQCFRATMLEDVHAGITPGLADRRLYGRNKRRAIKSSIMYDIIRF
jgi:hypothetical protein